MKKRSVSMILAAAVLGIGSYATVSHSHHSFGAVFDNTTERTVAGTLVRARIVNPHSLFTVQVEGEDGKVVEWVFEGMNPSITRAMGFKRSDIMAQVGKQVKINYNPAHREDINFGYGRDYQFETGYRMMVSAENLEK